ncbi:MAG: zf-HC2 domain-containing protein [Phycisphaerae bacterium]|nr:zf-HC2 domain-containing protein [Phycisphaerae bacterium]
MNCKQARELWHDKCDGRLQAADRASLAIHLETCEGCRQYHEQMGRLEGILSALRDSTESVGAPVVERRRARWISIWHVGRVAAVLALVVGAGLFVSQYERGGSGVLNYNPPLPSLINTASVQEPVTPAEIVLTGISDREFIAVAQKTSHPKVHMFRLYRTGGIENGEWRMEN